MTLTTRTTSIINHCFQAPVVSANRHANGMDGHAIEHLLNDALRLVSSNAIRITTGQCSTTEPSMLSKLSSAHTSRAERQTDEYSAIEHGCRTTIEETRNSSGTITRTTVQNGRIGKQRECARARRVSQKNFMQEEVMK